MCCFSSRVVHPHASSLFLVALLAASASSAALAQPPAPAAKHWAVLIAAEKYHRVTHLKYTVNDVVELSATLRGRGGYEEDQILLMTDAETNDRFKPLRTNVMKELPVQFDKAAAGDSMIVYFSGHGFRDADGKLYLAPLDCDPDDPAATCVPVEWLREQIGRCKAGFKLLVLDACHAGSEKGEDDDGQSPNVAAKDLGDLFRNLEGVVTLASSTAEEKSQIWDDKQQSLFSYWLNQGMKGHADENGDGAVDIDELYKFVFRNVTYTAKMRFPRAQTPVRIVRSGTPDVPAVIHLKPQTLREALAGMAELLADRVDERKLEKVGVLEFTNDTRVGELLGADFGLLGRFCSEEFERRLSDAGLGKFNIVDRRKLQTALHNEGFQLDDLGSTERMLQVSKSVGGMPVVAVGTLRNRAGRNVTIQCKLTSVDSDEQIGFAAGTAQLNESEWAMLGRSVKVEPSDRTPPLPTSDDASPRSTEDVVIENVDQRSRGPHPLQDVDFDFPIQIVVDGKPQPLVFKSVGEEQDARTECFVGLHAGDVYQIWVGNRAEAPVMMRLLVDGLNTLPESEGTKGISTTVWGKRINLDEAQAWRLNPNDPKAYRVNGIPTVAVSGFFTELANFSKYKEFTVVDAEKSLAARQKFSDQIGIITAAFYAEGAGGKRGLGTAAGKEQSIATKMHKASVGNLRSVVHIRYVDADALARSE